MELPNFCRGRHLYSAGRPSRWASAHILVSFFFLAYSLRSKIGCVPYFHTWCGIGANLECMSEMCCTRLAESTGHKNYAKIAICDHRTTLSDYIFATEACIDNRKKLVEQQYLLHMSAQYGELRPTNSRDRLASLGTPANFNGFRVLASLLHRRSSTEVTQTSHDVWSSPAGLVHYTHGTLFRTLAPNGILSGAKFTLRPSLAFSYIGSVNAQHSSSGRQPNYAACDKEGNYGTFAPRLRHLYSAGRPSRWASVHILSYTCRITQATAGRTN